MLESNRRAVFVHVPRCAGTSLEAAIFAQDHYSQHLTAAELRALLGPRAYDGAFRFAFVRDPLDRFLSAFYYLLFRGLTRYFLLRCFLLPTLYDVGLYDSYFLLV